MGIKDLSKIIKKYAPDSIKTVPISNYKYKVLTIDASIYLYQYKYREKNFINGILNQSLILLKNNITPFYIFDGKPPKEKKDTLKGRSDRKKENQTKIDDLNSSLMNVNTIQEIEDIQNEIKKIKRNMIYVRSQDKKDCMTLLKTLGIPHMVANGEAEILCSRICEQKLAFGCVSEDSDILPNGSPFLIRDFRLHQKYVQEYNKEELLDTLNITHEQFVDFCIMCGCDYVDRIKGIGPVNALKLIRKYKNIETILENISNQKKYKIPEDYDMKYKEARQLFTENDNDFILNNVKPLMKLQNPNMDEFNKFIETQESISPKFIKEVNNNWNKYLDTINRVMEIDNIKRRKQTNIMSFFS